MYTHGRSSRRKQYYEQREKTITEDEHEERQHLYLLLPKSARRAQILHSRGTTQLRPVT